YVTVNGVKLGSIVHTIRKGDRKTTVEEKAKLNELGFVWKCHDVLSFDEVLELFKEYKEEHGNLLVPFNYVTADGIYLGRIVDSIRTGNRKTTAEEKNILNELGFVWKCHDVLSFDEVLERLKDYKEEYGNLLVPKKYVTTDGTKLGGIVQRIRRGKRKTTVEEKAKLDELGFVWKVR
ncbi:MAG: helicase associated domain-containing protein, partial [Clostridia bacterium]|nr:helicase associated domain-containing protein [Clostridia bacterium]